ACKLVPDPLTRTPTFTGRPRGSYEVDPRRAFAGDDVADDERALARAVDGRAHRLDLARRHHGYESEAAVEGAPPLGARHAGGGDLGEHLGHRPAPLVEAHG